MQRYADIGGEWLETSNTDMSQVGDIESGENNCLRETPRSWKRSRMPDVFFPAKEVREAVGDGAAAAAELTEERGTESSPQKQRSQHNFSGG